jgi:aquaporin Z
MPEKSTPEDGVAETVRRLGAEAAGTFLVTAAAMAVDLAFYQGHGADYVSRWLTRGFTAAVVIYAFSEISGAHVDPAITFGFWLRRVFPGRMLIAYVVAQFAGALAAGGLLYWLYGSASALGASHPGPSFSAPTAFSCEVVLTTAVMLVILMTATQEAKIGKDAALAVGFSVAVCGFAAGPISGASMNPARSIAPQLLTGQFGSMWVYACGPLLGAAMAVAIARLLCGPPKPDERKAAQGTGKP